MLEHKRISLVKKREHLLASFSKAATSGKRKKLSKLSLEIRQANELLTFIGQLESGLPKELGNLQRFTVSSLFLNTAFKKLTADQDEQFVFITGIEVEGYFVLNQILELLHEKRTFVGVSAEPKASHKLLIRLEQFGHKLLAHFHSHPGEGADSTRPSGIDQKFQQRLESAGHKAVMAIFSRDGYIRFVRHDPDFEVEVYGQGVTKHEKNVFHLTDLS